MSTLRSDTLKLLMLQHETKVRIIQVRMQVYTRNRNIDLLSTGICFDGQCVMLSIHFVLFNNNWPCNKLCVQVLLYIMQTANSLQIKHLKIECAKVSITQFQYFKSTCGRIKLSNHLFEVSIHFKPVKVISQHFIAETILLLFSTK